MGLKVTFGKVLATVNSASNSVVSTFDSVNAGLGMLNNRISVEASKQSKALKVELHEYDTELAITATQRKVDRTIEANKFTAQSKQHQELFTEYYAEIKDLIAS